MGNLKVRLVVVVALVVLAAAASAERKAGIKVRFSKRALDELTQTARSVIANRLKELPNLISTKNPFLLGAIAGFADLRIVGIKALGHDLGEISLRYVSPNGLEARIEGAALKLEGRVEDRADASQIEEAKVLLDVSNVRAVYHMAFLKSKSGSLQLEQKGCNLTIGGIDIAFEGLGERDAILTDQGREMVETLHSAVGLILCAQVESSLIYYNEKLEQLGCISAPFKELKELRIDTCLIGDLISEEDGFEFQLVGATLHKEEEREPSDGDSTAARLLDIARSAEDEGKMVVVWAEQAVFNRMFRVLHKRDLLKVNLGDKTLPIIADKIKDALSELANDVDLQQIDEGSNLTVTLRTAEAPRIELISSRPNRASGTLKLNVGLQIKKLDGSEKEIKATITMSGDVSVHVDETTPAEDDSIFPKANVTMEIKLLKLSDVEGVDLSVGDKHERAERKLKQILSDFINDDVLSWTKNHVDLQEKYLPKDWRVARVENVTISAFDGGVKASGDFKFDVDQIVKIKKP